MRRLFAGLLCLWLIVALCCGCDSFRLADECRAHTPGEGVYHAVCGGVGYTEYVCLLCGETFTVADEAETPHEFCTEYVTGSCKYEQGTLHTCLLCGYSYLEKDESFTQPPHAFELVSYTAGNCLHEGCTLYRCSVCGETNEVYDGQLGAHVFAEAYTIDIPATTEHAGEKSRHCTTEGCDERTDITEIPQEGTLPFVPF